MLGPAYYGFHDAFWIFPCIALLAFLLYQSVYHPGLHPNLPALGDANTPSWWSPTMALRLSGILFRAQPTSQHGRAGREDSSLL